MFCFGVCNETSSLTFVDGDKGTGSFWVSSTFLDASTGGSLVLDSSGGLACVSGWVRGWFVWVSGLSDWGSYWCRFW